MHMIDNLGGRLGSFDRIERALAPGKRWSGFDRALGAGFFAERGCEDQSAVPPSETIVEGTAAEDGGQLGLLPSVAAREAA